jgi:predicted phosphodiesterase
MRGSRVRVAVISDIHADFPALARVLSAIDTTTPDEVWCLGDMVGLGGGDPAEVVDLVRENCALVLAGNHDAWVTGALTLDQLALPRHRMELTWQRAELADEQLSWLAARPSYGRRAGVELWHGSADDPLTGWVDTEGDAIGHLNRQRAALGLVGHTHRPAVAHCDRGVVRWGAPPPEPLDLNPGGRWLLNPGAVTGHGTWLELDLAAAVATWHRS